MAGKRYTKQTTPKAEKTEFHNITFEVYPYLPEKGKYIAEPQVLGPVNCRFLFKRRGSKYLYIIEVTTGPKKGYYVGSKPGTIADYFNSTH